MINLLVRHCDNHTPRHGITWHQVVQSIELLMQRFPHRISSRLISSHLIGSLILHLLLCLTLTLSFLLLALLRQWTLQQSLERLVAAARWIRGFRRGFAGCSAGRRCVFRLTFATALLSHLPFKPALPFCLLLFGLLLF
ncbi:hypothetical protein KC345_g40 [Hortaea werneckii]|nr:hypothetical protein KC345_g40 [Hortaea werneckii]